MLILIRLAGYKWGKTQIILEKLSEELLLAHQLLVQPRRFSSSQQVAQQVGGIINVCAFLIHMIHLVKGILGHICSYFFKAGCCLGRFFRMLPYWQCRRGYIAKPLLGKQFDLISILATEH